MEKTIFITGKDTFLGNELVQEFLGRDYRVFSTLNHRDEDRVLEEEDGRLVAATWNRRSPLSGLGLVRRAAAMETPLDEAYLLFTPARVGADLDSLGFAEIENALDDSWKGYFFLYRELLRYFRTEGRGTLNLVFYGDEPESLSSLEYALYQGFRAFAEAQLRNQSGRAPRVAVYECLSPDLEAFRSFLLEKRESPPGRSNRIEQFGARKGLLGRIFQGNG